MNNTLLEIIGECVNALELEINELTTTNVRGHIVHDGFFLGKENDLYLYIFRLDEEIYIMDEAPIRIIVDNTEVPGMAIYCEAFEVLLALTDFIGFEIETAKLFSEPWKLLIELQNRLKEIGIKSNRNKELTKKIVEDIPTFASLRTNIKKDNLGQAAAIYKAMIDDVTFIWGPPGTGKTYTMANIALKAFLSGEKVLIISHSNIAVDGAIESIWNLISNELMDKIKENYDVFPIIRYGYSRTDFIKNNPYLNSYNLALNLDDELRWEIEELEAAIENLFMEIRTSKYDLEDKQLEIIHLKRKLSSLKKNVRNIEKKVIVPKAKIIATTISKIQIDQVLYDKMYDLVLLDEASMAYIPQSIYAASLAKKRVVFVGDFRQLPPIAISEGELVDKWLKKDIFDFSRVKDCVDAGEFHPNMIMLNKQRRMHPNISRFVNENIYSNLLIDHPSVVSDIPSEETLSIIDTSGMPTICITDENRSRLNVLNAFISVLTAIKYYEEGYDSIGIITPYNAQSKLIKNILDDVFADKYNSKISCATVHKFQGSERDIIIFDTVDSYRLRNPGVLLTDDRDDKSLRLINVALTRARKKFILISNMQYWSSRLKRGNILYKLLNYMTINGAIYNDKYVYDELKSIIQSYKSFFICNFDSNDEESLQAFMEKFVVEIANCDSIYVSIPTSISSSIKLLETPLLKALNNNPKMIIRTEDINLIPERLKDFSTEDVFTWLPIIIINENLLYYGYPLIFNDYVNKNLVIKFNGHKTIKNLIAKLNIKFKESNLQTSLKEFVEEFLRCKNCGHPLTIRKSRSNKYFIACTNYPSCNHTERIDKNLVDFYLAKYNLNTCNECKGQLIAKYGKYGLFIGCNNYPTCKNTRNIDRYI